MPNRILSILNPDNGRFAITINSEEVLLLITKIREIVKEEVYNTYRKKLSEEYLTRKELIEMLKVSENVLTKWNHQDFLTPVKVGGKSLYKKSDVIKIISVKNKKPKRRKKTQS